MTAVPKGYPQLPRLGDRVKWAREERGWSVQRTSEELQKRFPDAAVNGRPVHWLVLRQIEMNQQQTTSDSLLEGLSQVFGVDEHWLATGEAQRKQQPEAQQSAAQPSQPTVQAPQHQPRVLPSQPNQAKPNQAKGHWPPGQMREIPGDSLGAIVRDRRMELGLSQRQVGESVGLTGQAVSAMELNKTVGKAAAVSVPTQIRILRSLGLTEQANRLSDQLEGEKPPTTRPVERPVERRLEDRPAQGVPNIPDMARLGLMPGVAARMRAQRAVLGLAQHDVAARSGTQAHHVSLAEAGKSTPALSVRGIANALRVTPEWLLYGIPTPPPGIAQEITHAPAATATPERPTVEQRPAEPQAVEPQAVEHRAVERPTVTPQPVPKPVEKPSQPRPAAKPDADDKMIRPRQATNLEVEADSEAFYLFYSRRAFRKTPTGTESVQEIVAPLSVSPRLAKAMRDLLIQMVAQYEETQGEIT